MRKNLIVLAILAGSLLACVKPVYAASTYLEPMVRASVEDPHAKVSVLKSFPNGVTCGKVIVKDKVLSFGYDGRNIVFTKEGVQYQIDEYLKQLSKAKDKSVIRQITEEISAREFLLNSYSKTCGPKW